MKIAFIDKKEEMRKIPAIGQVWMHKSGGEVYMRSRSFRSKSFRS